MHSVELQSRGNGQGAGYHDFTSGGVGSTPAQEMESGMGLGPDKGAGYHAPVRADGGGSLYRSVPQASLMELPTHQVHEMG